uniref:non-specific serine/threonine protein kinase n=1 Tax=Cereibacter sphaeroides (strain KD131 / KCTC 12085) TaxID=557760 RepID=A0AAX7FLD9_CERSK|nr:Chain A, Circadian clock protein KaiC [Cereibacter sphaeroides]8FWI_B Chain B, Circadian clock protein KaiC [Cereibacter sphaeroides]8FWI_C Chain C, Circadian clock protein KaiC [Cereibacter sphaeroides]8FWI_D Chain D, Circadian clock protein KaiC [Cereibacter sphaeroides]8FWI_E Chain E, Circadian clock protein KaiC [Cereibacter sphaeroides]8FWI_F Chain F, Circadian clock protein KaiC [Cereibacter sphaeroides]8FWI_G Chain G, Circadian clock protein KaiC [Cereibacter sphaeroides]8FWI_H Cha
GAMGIGKSPTGIQGFDELTLGGLPTGRPSLVCGSAGCGKTLFASTFLINGVRDHGEPGVFVTFEERPEDIVNNVASLGFELDKLIEEEKIAIEHIAVDPSEVAEIGDYDLEGLFLRLELAIDTVGAKRVVLDTIESLFSAFSNPAILRAEIRRLFDWLKERGLTTVITAERGDGALTRQGLEEYVSDCVILLDHRVENQISTRRLRIVKYRGTAHGTNEYPFLIDTDGFSVLPVSALGLLHQVHEERIASGVPDLDAMMAGGGFFRGSSILVSGVAGAGKSSLAAHFAAAACARGERAMYFSFEEAADQAVRNMRSLGLDLGRWRDAGLLRFMATRPTFYSLEMHLAVILREVMRFEPSVVVLDPISAFTESGDRLEVQSMLLRIVDFLKNRGITGIFTHLAHSQNEATTDAGLEELMDGWVLMLNREVNGEFNRELYLLKARGMAHSNQVREFLMSDRGISLLPPHLGEGGALTGTARKAEEARLRRAEIERQTELGRLQQQIEQRRRRARAQIEALEAELQAEEIALKALVESESAHERQRLADADTLARSRGNERFADLLMNKGE